MIESPVVGTISSMLFSFNSRSQSYLENFPHFVGVAAAVLTVQRACCNLLQCAHFILSQIALILCSMQAVCTLTQSRAACRCESLTAPAKLPAQLDPHGPNRPDIAPVFDAKGSLGPASPNDLLQMPPSTMIA